jgi:glycosyltransferase involved in cell wall biosynthesis
MKHAVASVTSGQPKPSRVAYVDLDVPLPAFADGVYETAMVIGGRRGVPVGVVEIDLLRGPDDISDQLAALLALPSPSGAWMDEEIADGALPAITVVVPTIVARIDGLARLLEGIAAVDYPDLEVILVDNRRNIPTGDALPALVAGRVGVRVIREPQPGISAARNAGAAAARGEIVAFTDDDVVVDRNWLRAIGRRFILEPELQAVAGLILPAEMETPSQIWYERYYGGFGGTRTFVPVTLKAPLSLSRVLRGSQVEVTGQDGTVSNSFSVYGVGAYVAGANMAFRKDALIKRGGFDLNLGTGTAARGGEDLASMIDILWTGGTVGFEPASVVHHRHRREFDELVHQIQGNGVGFTAMITSLILQDRRHLVSLVSQLPRAAKGMLLYSLTRLNKKPVDDTTAKEDASDAGFPRSLVLHELRSYFVGPFAYNRSWRSNRTLRRRARTNVPA